MPELPEVETVTKLLKPIIVGHYITHVEIFNKRMILSEVLDFEKSLVNKKITDVTRKGKFIIIHFEQNTVLISHLRMEGKFIECQENEPLSNYARVVFYLEDKRKICFDDTRQFGILMVSSEDKYLIEEPISKLGPEPFYIKNGEYLLNLYRKRRKPIKEVILDQTIMAGLGNIYADETLYRCHIHPLTPANELTLQQCNDIVSNSIDVLNKAIALGGSTIRSYHAAKGIDGKFQNELLVYGKEGQRCHHDGCLANYKKIFVGGRGTTYCPVCQQLKNKPFILGVTGPIASGKSTATKLFSKYGIRTISADEIVTTLYKEKETELRVIGLLGNEAYINHEVNRPFIRQLVSHNLTLKAQLEGIIHPQVQERIYKFINDNYEEPFLVIEVPLLFESKMDEFMDATLAINVTLGDQIANLQKRNSNVDESLVLNQTNTFNKYKKQLTYLLDTNNKIEQLDHQVKQIIDNVLLNHKKTAI